MTPDPQGAQPEEVPSTPKASRTSARTATIATRRLTLLVKTPPCAPVSTTRTKRARFSPCSPSYAEVVRRVSPIAAAPNPAQAYVAPPSPPSPSPPAAKRLNAGPTPPRASLPVSSSPSPSPTSSPAASLPVPCVPLALTVPSKVACPIPLCGKVYAKASLKQHLLTKHLAVDLSILTTPGPKLRAMEKWLAENSCNACPEHHTLFAASRRCNVQGCHTDSWIAPAISAEEQAQADTASLLASLPETLSPSEDDIYSDKFLLSILQCEARTLTYVPKPLCLLWAGALQMAIDAVLSHPNSRRAWAEFLMLPKCILRQVNCVGLYGSRQRAAGVRKAIKSRLARWGDDKDQESLAAVRRRLFDEACEAKIPVTQASQMERNLRQCEKLASIGRFKDACQTLQSAGIHEPSMDIRDALAAKHPQATLPVRLISKDFRPDPVVVEKEMLLVCLHSFKKRTAPGGTQMRAEHLKAALQCAQARVNDQSTACMTRLANFLLAGKAPQWIGPFLAAAPLIALKKHGDVTGVRPIAIGEIFRRLVSKIACKLVKERAMEFLEPLQLGVGHSSSAEAILHATQAVVDAHGQEDNVVMFKVDFKNAFNLVNRNIMFGVVKEHFPELLPWVEFCYAGAAHLTFGSHLLSSATGVQQGDPLGPLLFSLVLQRLICTIKKEVPDLLVNVWYLDDGVLIGSPGEVRKAYDILVQQGPDMGLFLSPPKSELWWPRVADASFPQFPQDVGKVPGQGVGLLGGPIGDVAFTGEFFAAKVETMKGPLDALCKLGSKQVKLALLRACLGLPKIQFNLRTCPPSSIEGGIGTYDALVGEVLVDIVGPEAATQATRAVIGLPLKLGGMGIPTASSRAACCFVASVTQSKELQEAILPEKHLYPRVAFRPCLTDFNASLSLEGDQAVSILCLEGLSHPQAYCSSLLDKAAMAEVLTAHISNRDRAMRRSCSLPGATDYLMVLPVKELGHALTNQEALFLYRRQLCLPVYDSTSTCPSCKKADVNDILGDHALVCKSGDDNPITRHNTVASVVARHAKECRLKAEAEVKNLLPDSNKRPGDVFIEGWKGSRAAAFDLCICSPTTDSSIMGASLASGVAANMAFDRKSKKVEAECLAQGFDFYPLIFENSGGMHKGVIEYLEGLVQRGFLINERAEAATRFRRELSFTLHKTQALSLVIRAPPLMVGVVPL